MSPLRREWGVNEAQTAGRSVEPAGLQRRHSSVIGVQQNNFLNGAVLNRSRVVGSVMGMNHHGHNAPPPLPPLRTGGQQHQQAFERSFRRIPAASDIGIADNRRQIGAQPSQPYYSANLPRYYQPQTQPYLPQELRSPPSPARYPPPPYSTMPRYPSANQPPAVAPRRVCYPESVISTNNNCNNRYDIGRNGKGIPMIQPSMTRQLYVQQQPTSQSMANQGYYDANPVDVFGIQPQWTNGDLAPPSPQSVDLKGYEGSIAETDPPRYMLGSYSPLEVFIKIFALFSLLFPPTGIGAVVCAFTANKESSQRFRAARQKVSLILASVGFTAILFIIVVVIIATQVIS